MLDVCDHHRPREPRQTSPYRADSRLKTSRTVLAHCMSMQCLYVVSPSASRPQQLCLPKSLSPTYLIGIVASSRIMPTLFPQAKVPTARVPNMEPRMCMEIPVLHKESPRRRATSVERVEGRLLCARGLHQGIPSLEGPTRMFVPRSEAGSGLRMEGAEQGRL